VLVAHQVIGLAPGAWALDPDAAVLRRTNHDRSSIDHALEAVCAAMHVVDPPPAAVFTVAVPHLILDRYPAGMPLLWHDAGALLATIHLVATDLGAGSCIVGTSGVLHPNLGDPLLPVDTGVVAIGRYV
jgi:SagB-type dehydrogenase family enzyme